MLEWPMAERALKKFVATSFARSLKILAIIWTQTTQSTCNVIPFDLNQRGSASHQSAFSEAIISYKR